MHVHLFARPRLLAPVLATAVLLLLVLPGAANAQRGFYQQRNLVSDLPNVAKFQDPNLVNAWGLSHSPTGPWQISDNGTGLSTQYKSNGMGIPPVVTIPLPECL